MFISSNGVALQVEQQGAGSPAFVFLHYWGGSSNTWRHVIDRLSGGFRTIAYDQRGWGKSDAPHTGYSISDLADDAQAVIEALDLERYILVGHSMGGKAAQLLASRQPEGLAGLALIAPAPPTAMGAPLEIREGMVHAYDTRESIIATVEQVLAPGGLASEDLEQVVADSLVGATEARSAWPLATSQEDISADVSSIKVPVLIVSGEDDRVDPPAVLQRELVARLPDARFVVLPGVGHLSPLEAPAALAEELTAFVERITRGA